MLSYSTDINNCQSELWAMHNLLTPSQVFPHPVAVTSSPVRAAIEDLSMAWTSSFISKSSSRKTRAMSLSIRSGCQSSWTWNLVAVSSCWEASLAVLSWAPAKTLTVKAFWMQWAADITTLGAGNNEFWSVLSIVHFWASIIQHIFSRFVAVQQFALTDDGSSAERSSVDGESHLVGGGVGHSLVSSDNLAGGGGPHHGVDGPGAVGGGLKKKTMDCFFQLSNKTMMIPHMSWKVSLVVKGVQIYVARARNWKQNPLISLKALGKYLQPGTSEAFIKLQRLS